MKQFSDLLLKKNSLVPDNLKVKNFLVGLFQHKYDFQISSRDISVRGREIHIVCLSEIKFLLKSDEGDILDLIKTSLGLSFDGIK